MPNRTQSHKPRRPSLNLIAKAIRKMSKSTQVIIVITAVAVVCSAAFPIGHFSASNLFIASVGGLVVFAGLWIEKDADEDKEKHLGKFSSAKRLIKLRSNIGWWALMFGIGIEIADAGWTAHEIRLTSTNVNRIDPANLPVLNVNAFVKLRVKGNKFPDLKQWDSIPISTNWGSKRATATLHGNGPNSVLSSSIPTMIADDFGIGAGYPDFREYFLNFRMESVSAAMNLPVQSASKTFSAANFISINVRFLPPQSEILDGYAFVVVNNSLWKLFRIYPQKNTQPPFPNNEQAEILSKIPLHPVMRLVVSGSTDAVAGVIMKMIEPGKVTSISNSEVFPVEAGFFMAECTLIGTNVPSGKFDPNW